MSQTIAVGCAGKWLFDNVLAVHFALALLTVRSRIKPYGRIEDGERGLMDIGIPPLGGDQRAASGHDAAFGYARTEQSA